MTKPAKIILSIVLIALCGCSQVKNRFGGGYKTLARVGDEELLATDIKGVFTSGMTGQDSLKLLESYIDMWVRKQVKIIEAEAKFSTEDQADIDRLVKDYRNSLLSNKLDQYWTDNQLAPDITDAEIRDYYDNHMFEFLLDRPIVKGSIAVIPVGFSGRSTLMKLMNGSASQWEDFVATMEKNKFELYDYDSWTDASVFLSRLSSPGHGDFTYLLSSNSVTEVKEGSVYYLVYIREKRNQGDVSPLERVSELISRILYNQKKSDIIKLREDSLVKVAKDKKKIDINI